MRNSKLLLLAGPLVISFWFRATFAWADAAFASFLRAADGTAIGDQSIAAIGLTQPFEFLQIALWVGTSNGLTARLAAAMGAGQGARVDQLVRASRRIILVLIGFFVALAAAMWFIIPTLALDPVVRDQFRIYATVLVAGGALTSFWSILPDSLVKAHHDTRTTMWAGIASSSLNVVLNAFFVFVMHWGIFGIALSTVLGRFGGLVYATRRADAHERLRRLRPDQQVPGLDLAPVRSILAIAVPSGATYVLMAVESQFVNLMLAGVGTVATSTSLLAAWAIYERTVRFMAMPAIATSVAMLPLAARLHGARDYPQVRRELGIGARASLIYVLLLVAPLTYLLGPRVVAALADAPSTRVFADEAMFWLPLTVAAIAPFMIARAAWDGMERPLRGLAAAIVRSLGLQVPAVWLGLRHHEALGISPMLGAALASLLATALASAAFWIWSSASLRRLAATTQTSTERA
jgi:Na+-driven multidrug efflux pump